MGRVESPHASLRNVCKSKLVRREFHTLSHILYMKQSFLGTRIRIGMLSLPGLCLGTRS